LKEEHKTKKIWSYHPGDQYVPKLWEKKRETSQPIQGNISLINTTVLQWKAQTKYYDLLLLLFCLCNRGSNRASLQK